jgi:YbgC/YbaW family acyl-CoA thioester hydrolase
MRNKKIIAPAHVCYKTSIDVQIGDINYGGHVGNERYLLFAQETRLRFLQAIGHSEVHFGEFGLVLTESHVEYFNELFHGDSLEITLALTTPSRASFDCYYTITVTRNNTPITAAVVKTAMVCFDYTERKVKSIPEALRGLLTRLAEGDLV